MHHILYITYYTLYITYYKLHIIYYRTMHYILHIIYHTLYIMYYIFYTIYYTNNRSKGDDHFGLAHTTPPHPNTPPPRVNNSIAAQLSCHGCERLTTGKFQQCINSFNQITPLPPLPVDFWWTSGGLFLVSFTQKNIKKIKVRK